MHLPSPEPLISNLDTLTSAKDGLRYRSGGDLDVVKRRFIWRSMCNNYIAVRWTYEQKLLPTEPGDGLS